MKEVLRRYLELVPFLGSVLGPDYEVVLHEIGEENRILAIANGHVSGRQVGAPLTNKAMRIIEEKPYYHEKSEVNYPGRAMDGKTLRSSTYYIKDDDGELAGLLCLNFDDSRYRNLLEQVLRLCHPDDFVDKNAKISFAPSLVLGPDNCVEEFSGTAEDAISDVIGKVIAASTVPVERMTQEEKMEIVDKLNRHGVFAIKGAVSLVAKSLNNSEATIYRYLSKLKKT